MFEDLTIKLEGIFKKLRGREKLSESNIKVEGVRKLACAAEALLPHSESIRLPKERKS